MFILCASTCYLPFSDFEWVIFCSRFVRTKSLESGDDRYLEEKFKEICSEPLSSVLHMAGRDDTVQDKRAACHFAVAIANESDAAGDVLSTSESSGSSVVNDKVCSNIFGSIEYVGKMMVFAVFCMSYARGHVCN